MPSTPPKVIPPLVLAAALAGQAALTRGTPVRDYPGRAVLAGAIAASAVAVASLASRAISAHDTTIDARTPEQTTTLIDDGVFSSTRNPIYLGMAGLLAANAVRSGHARTLVPLAAFVAWVDRLQIPAEEEALAARFGATYDDYRTRTRRWL